MGSLQKAFRKIRNELFKAVFAGEGFLCPYCGKSYRRFMHQGARAECFRKHSIVGAGYKRNVRCPNCGSKQRMRLYHLFFQLRTDVYRKRVRLLDISPNKRVGSLLRSHDNIDYVCGALYPDRFAELDAIRVDVTDIPFPDQDFDVVICSHVLEHVRDDTGAMHEIYRVLRPGGFALLQVPLALDLQETEEDPSVVDEKDRLNLYGQKDHLRLYGMDYFDKLRAVGFRVELDNPFDNHWLPDPEKYCLERAEDVILGFRA